MDRRAVFVAVVLRRVLVCCVCLTGVASLCAQAPRRVSGIHPHLAMANDEGECGVGAVVPWADRLWAITYAPHAPQGSSDRLYEITPDLQQIVRAESRGGTHANRLIHRESAQLFLGPYAIDANRRVRVIPHEAMYGRLTGTARHLTDPAHKVYVATMEEGLYEVDVTTLAVTELWTDEQRPAGRHAGLPGYHGKGLYSGQGRLVYANNGEHGALALREPATPSGVLAEWDGKAPAWTVVRRNQFTEVTGPGGIHGNEEPGRDPLWSVGWDHRSLLLQVLDAGTWHTFRLPKGSHAYDGAHGWNTEWPRIRDIGEHDLLMTMHGLLWRFPRRFRADATAGIAPRSAYLKVIGDFCRWQDQVVFGCDDTAKSEFQNRRRAKGEIAAPRSQSNLWFVAPGALDSFGPALGRGGVWVHENVVAGAVSDPFLVAGFAQGGLHLAHRGAVPATFVVELDPDGRGNWVPWQSAEVPAGGHRWLELDRPAVWLRMRAPAAIQDAVAFCQLAARDGRNADAAAEFAGLLAHGQRAATGGLVRTRGGQAMTLAFAAVAATATGVTEVGCYELDGALRLAPTTEPALHEHTKANTRIPVGVLQADAASVLYVDDAGRRWRLPRSRADDDEGPFGPCRVAREVATERDLFHAHGTFYELPADNAGGFAKVRPVASHDRLVHDFCSYRGLFVASGVAAGAAADDPHVVHSTDGKVALWVGAIDDLWRLGKPRGRGGPWLDTAVVAGVPSDPYLVTGYDEKVLTLAHDGAVAVEMTVEADLCGTGQWTVVQRCTVPAGRPFVHAFPRGWSAYWLRVRAAAACRATAQLVYR